MSLTNSEVHPASKRFALTAVLGAEVGINQR